MKVILIASLFLFTVNHSMAFYVSTDSTMYQTDSNEVKLFFDQYGQLYPEDFFSIWKTEALKEKNNYKAPIFKSKNSNLSAVRSDRTLQLNEELEFGFKNAKPKFRDEFIFIKEWNIKDFLLRDYRRILSINHSYGIQINPRKLKKSEVGVIEPLQTVLMQYKQMEFKQQYDQLTQKNGSPPKVLFFIHGYGNGYTDVKFQKEKLIEKHGDVVSGAQNILFVSVFWYGANAKKEKVAADGNKNNRYIKMLNLFKPCVRSSYYVGIELRRFINGLEPNIKLHFLSHSLGANVITSIFKNHSHKLMSKFNKKNQESFKNNYSEKFNDTIYHYPQQPLNIAMGAAAIPGVASFDRQSNGRSKLKVIVGFNDHDATLSQGIFSKIRLIYGETSLGCNRKVLLKTLLEYPFVRVINFSKKENPKKHKLTSYMNSINYKVFLKELLEIK